jgi:hypothetical protein
MRYAIYEHPLTHLFAFVVLPHGFVEGEELPPVVTDHWFDSREEAIAALPTLLDLEDVERDPAWEDRTPNDTGSAEAIRQIHWLMHEDAQGPSVWRN